MTSTEDRLARLQQKRELFRARLKRRAQGEFSDPVMLTLRRGRFRAVRVSAGEQMAVIRPFTLLPGIDEHVDWSCIPGHRWRVWTAADQRVNHLREAMADLGLGGDTRVLIVFHPAFAGIRTTAAAVLANATTILDANPEIWLCAADGGDWLIEAAGHDICWAQPAATLP